MKKGNWKNREGNSESRFGSGSGTGSSREHGSDKVDYEKTDIRDHRVDAAEFHQPGISIFRSPKQLSTEKKILSSLSGRPLELAKVLFADDVLQGIQEYANSVSITRMGMNDHGPVHMRIAMQNSIDIFNLLVDAGVEPNLVSEKYGTVEDSLMAVMLGTFLHDLGMSVGRQNHELMSSILAQEHIGRILGQFYDDPIKLAVMRSLVTECIVGHMATQKIGSLEAGIVLVADGCDMIGGRARISMSIAKVAHVGDIHRYSAYSITNVKIDKGSEKPVCISVKMNESAGFFQVEQVLMPKVMASPIKKYIELYAKWGSHESQRYL